MKIKFLEDENTMVITTKNILKGNKSVVLVSHDEDDGMWEFLDGDDVVEENAAVISLREMIEIDSTINDVYDLPLGCIAYREEKGKEWIRKGNVLNS